MSLLTICQGACGEAGIAASTSIVGNSSQQAETLLALANLAGQSIARRPQGGWVSMIREYDFQTAATLSEYSGSVANTGVGGTAQVTIPQGVDTPDLDQVTGGTWVASGTGLLNNSVVTSVSVDGMFNYVFNINLAAADEGPGTYQFGQSDYTLPSDFQRPIDNTFWDRTRYWSMRGPQSPQMWQLYKSSTIGMASIQRRYRFRYISGKTRLSIDPTPFDDGSQLVFEYVSNGWCESVGGTPQTSWQSDDDIGVLDEYLIQLDLTWRLLRRLGLSYSDEQAEAMIQIDRAMAQDGGAAILDMTPRNYLTLIGPWNIPESGFGGPGAAVGDFIIGVSEIG